MIPRRRLAVCGRIVRFPLLRFNPETGLHRLEELFIIPTRAGEIHVWPGFETDGASIPRFLWSTIGHPFTGRYQPGAVVHDALYMARLLTRQTADAILFDLCRAAGVSVAKAALIYTGVAAFGGFPYHGLWPASGYTSEQRESARKLVFVR